MIAPATRIVHLSDSPHRMAHHGLLHQQADRLLVALLDCEIKSSESTLFRDLFIRTMSEYNFHELVAAKHRSEHKGRTTIAVLHIEARTVRDEKFCNILVAFEAHTNQGRISTEILCVDIRIRFDQQFRGIQLPIVGCDDQWRVATGVLDIYVCSGSNEFFQSQRITLPGSVE